MLLNVQLAAAHVRFPQAYEQLCAKLNRTEIFKMRFGIVRAINCDAILTALEQQ
jgi:hypothetical protein